MGVLRELDEFFKITATRVAKNTLNIWRPEQLRYKNIAAVKERRMALVTGVGIVAILIGGNVSGLW